MALRGTLESFPAAEILPFLAATKRTGTLKLYDESDTTLLSFRDGRLVNCIHQRQLLQLGEIIVHRGYATETEINLRRQDARDQWDAAVSRAQARRRAATIRVQKRERRVLQASPDPARLGRLLVSQGIITQSQLDAATDPAAMPESSLAALLCASGLLTPTSLDALDALDALDKTDTDPLFDRVICGGDVTRAQIEYAITHVSEESFAELLVSQGVIDRKTALVSLDQLESLGGRAVQTVRLGEYLLAKGLVTESQVERALWQQLVNDRRLGEILISQRAITEEDLEVALTELETLRADFGPLFTLCRALVDELQLDMRHWDEALAEQKATGQPLAAVLIASGHVTHPEFLAVLRRRLVDSIVDVLVWKDASFEFLEGVLFDNDLFFGDLPQIHQETFDLSPLLDEAQTALIELEQTAFRELSPTTVLVQTTDPEFTQHDSQSGSERILARFDGRRSVDEVRRVLPGNRPAHYRLFVRLVESGRARPMQRDEAYYDGLMLLDSGHAEHALVLLQHALGVDGDDPPADEIETAIREARASADAGLAAFFGSATQAFSQRSRRIVRRLTSYGLVAGTLRSVREWRGRVMHQLGSLMIRIGAARQFWMMRSKFHRWLDRTPIAQAISKSKVFAIAASAVAIALLLPGTPEAPTENETVTNARKTPASRHRERTAEWTGAGPIENSPAITADGRIVVAARDGLVRALDFETSGRSNNRLQVEWEVRVGEFGDIVSPPTAHGRNVFVSTVRGVMFALSAIDGRVLWSKRLPRLEPLAPVPLLDANGSLTGVAVVSRESAYVLSPDDGRAMFRVQTANQVLTAPIGDSEMLVVGSGDNRIYGAHWTKGKIAWTHYESDDVVAMDRVEGRVVFATRDGYLGALDIRSGEQLWKRSFPRNSIRSVRAADRQDVFVATQDNEVVVINSVRGTTSHSYVPDPGVDATTMHYAGDIHLFGSTDGHVGELDARGSLVWRSEQPIGDLAGWARGPKSLVLTSRQGDVVVIPHRHAKQRSQQ